MVDNKNCTCCQGLGYHIIPCNPLFRINCLPCKGTGKVDCEIEIGAIRGCTVNDSTTPEGKID
jgi:hypothetical protein